MRYARFVPVRAIGLLVRAWLLAVSKLPPRQALIELLNLEDHIALRLDQAAIALDGGVHPKHRLTRYHDFFVDRIAAEDRVLDVGCGIGEVAADIAARSGASVTGIDFDPAMLAVARAAHVSSRLAFVEADALDYRPKEDYDVVVLSNVLEHVADRVSLLTQLAERTRASRLLIRVPAYDRDWHVPMREELGLSPFQDATHEIEYRPGELDEELRAAGFAIEESIRAWGEIWVSARRTS